MAYADTRAPTFANQLEEAPPVTVDSLVRHYKAHGLENAHAGYKGREKPYTTYSQARKDALVHVARTFLTEDAYVQLLDLVKLGGWEREAREDWRVLHGQEQA